MGCSALGNLYRAMSDDDAIATVEAALAHGIGYFDVAPHYGFGMAERRLGMALAKHVGPAPLVSTKVGRLLAPTAAGGTRHGFVDADPYEPDFDYREDAVLASHEASLARLGLARVGYPAMRRLKETGRIDAIGIGVNEIAICERLLDEVPLDVILLAGRYTLLEQGALPLLDRCARDGVKVIVGGPYNSGLLVEAPNGVALHYDYAAAPAPAVARAQALWTACSAYAVALPAAALQFPLAHPAVTSVVAGLATPAQVADLASWTEADIPGGLWRHLRAAGFLAPSAPTPA
jgi:D-threo-aldose 1-dehydrogenase